MGQQVDDEGTEDAEEKDANGTTDINDDEADKKKRRMKRMNMAKHMGLLPPR